MCGCRGMDSHLRSCGSDKLIFFQARKLKREYRTVAREPLGPHSGRIRNRLGCFFVLWVDALHWRQASSVHSVYRCGVFHLPSSPATRMCPQTLSQYNMMNENSMVRPPFCGFRTVRQEAPRALGDPPGHLGSFKKTIEAEVPSQSVEK